MKLTPTQIVAINEQQAASMPDGFRFVDARIARTLATELESWMERCQGVEEQMTGLRREVEHQKSRVKAYSDDAETERINRVAACRTLTFDCNLRGKYIRQLREAILKLPARCSCGLASLNLPTELHLENCSAKIKAEALKLKDDSAEPANDKLTP